MSQEGRCIDVFGPQLFLETGSNEVGTPGRTAYTLQSINSSGDKYNQGLYESGLSRHYAEKSLQVECGIKNSNEQDSYVLIAHKGNINVNSEAGWVRVKGQNIVIEVDGEQHNQQQAHDQSRDALLRSLNFKVLRYSARDVRETPNIVIEKILENIK